MFRVLAFAALALFTVGRGAWGQLQPAGVFGDHMMLQREGRAAIWGTAAPGSLVTLSLLSTSSSSAPVATVSAQADAAGKWMAAFQGLKAGGPFDLKISDKPDEVTIHDVLVGDIWVCSGQSNMDYRLRDKPEIDSPPDPLFRYLLIPRKQSVDPQNEIEPGAHWVSAAPNTRSTFTAVGYYFGKRLRQETGVPIGLIHSSWGGTAAELWIPEATLEEIPQLRAKVTATIANLRALDTDAARFATDFAAWQQKYGPLDPGNTGFAKGWASPDFDASGWTPLPSAGDWTSLAAPNGGVIWLRKTIPVAPKAAGKDLHLYLGVVRDLDTTYFNGEEVGHDGTTPPYFLGGERSYVIPGRLVKAGNNLLAIRVVSQSAKNAVFGYSNHLGSGIDATSVPPMWLAKVETAFDLREKEALASEPKVPTARMGGTPAVLFNGMIHPLIPYGIKGVIWYQGEANGGRGYNYRTLLTKLIESWRTQWGQGDFPFYIVQIANLGQPPATANDPPGWAELRESQLYTWQTVPHTGMAVTIDIGEGGNVHPKNKVDVGDRLAKFALVNEYGKKLEDSGPVYQSMTVVGNTIHLQFSHTGAGLMAKGGEPLRMFTIAGADRSFAWADATISGDEVVVSCKEVPSPVAVRYAWFPDPEGLNLYNKDGLPAPPFRTDDWPAVSVNGW